MTKIKITDQMMNTVKTTVKTLLVGGTVACVLFGYLYAMQKIKAAGWEEEKKCFKELTLIMEQNPREKKEWIEKTIMAEKTVISGTHYCAVLELVTESEKDQVTGKGKPDAGLVDK